MQRHRSLATNYRLQSLKKWLNFELPGIVLFAISFFFHIALTFLQGAALIFTPYLLYVLFMERRYGWMAAFGLGVVIPSLVIFYLFGAPVIAGNPLLAGSQIIAGYVPLAFFFSYCYILKLSIPAMLEG